MDLVSKIRQYIFINAHFLLVPPVGKKHIQFTHLGTVKLRYTSHLHIYIYTEAKLSGSLVHVFYSFVH